MAIFETPKYRFPYPDGAESLSNIALNFQALAERLETTYELLGISYPIVAGVALMQEGDPAGGDLTNYYPNPTITTSAVTTSKINDQAVTTAKIADLNVTTGKIANDAVTTAKLAVVDLKDGSTAVTQPQSDGSTKVATTAYVDAYIAGTVPDGSIGTSELADGAVTNAKVNASAAIAYSKLNLASSIVNADVATGAAIAYSKLALSGAIQESDLAFSIATQSELDTVASNAATALSNHESDTTSIHGISDTANLVYTNDSRLSDSRTPTGAAGGVLSGTYPNPGFAVDMATQTELDNHASDTTSVHGIADTSVLATQTDVSTAVSTHSSDTTSVHGISDTANLVYTNDSRLSDSRTPTGGAGGVLSGSYPNPGFAVDMATQSELDNHASDTTSVHGIADTSVLATSTDVSTAVSTHAAVTTSVHGISNTANLVYTNDSRLTDARTPTIHATSHVPGGVDAIDLTKIVGIGASLPTLPNALYPAGALFGVGAVAPYLLYRSTGSAWDQIGGAGGASVTTSDTAPATPNDGDLWYKTSNAKTYVYYEDGSSNQWVEVGAASQLVIPQHGSSHVRGGADVIDGDRLTVDYVPTNYTRNSAASGAGNNTDLTAHLSGLDIASGQMGLVLLYNNNVTVAGAAGTETFVNNVFSSTYDNYKILINCYSSSLGDQVRMRLQNSGVSSISSYFAGMPYMDLNTSYSWVADGDSNISYWRIIHPGSGSALSETCTFDLLGPALSRETIAAGNCMQNSRYMRTFMAAHRVATAYSGLSFHTVNGGTITFSLRVYGYKNSL